MVLVTLQDITERKRAEEVLQYRLAFENHITAISSRLVNLHYDEIDSGIYDALSRIGQFVSADRAYIFGFHDDQQFISNTYEWCAEGVAPQIETLQNIPTESVPWWTKKLNNFETIHLRDLDELPPEAERSRKILELQNIQSLIVVPLTLEDRLIGFIGFDTVSAKTEWSSDTVTLLQTIGEIIANTQQRQRSEITLRHSEEKYRRMFELSPEAIVLLDTQGNIVEVNQRIDDLLGYSPEEVKGKNLMELPYLTQNSKEKLKIHFTERIKGGEIPPYELDFVARNGEHHIGLVHSTLLTDTDGHVNADLVLIADITKRKRAEEEKEKLQYQLRQAQKMESIGHLAGGVAHDFNNMLMGIMGYTELCRDSIGKEHPVRGYLDEIMIEAERSANLTRQLLAFARKQTIAPKILDLNDAITNILKMLHRLIGEDIDLVWVPGANLCQIKVDPGQLDQILANLCVNARDAIKGVGKVTIETSNLTIDEDYCTEHVEALPGKYVMLAVSDDGLGMDSKTLENIFEPFYTTKGVGEGTGLGLATVYGIVKQNNGFVNVYSEPGKGTTFRIYLPGIEEETANADINTPTDSLLGGTETVLLVEDDKGVRVILSRFLKTFGYTVLSADSGKAALKLAADHGEAIQLLITDVVMPGMNGRDLAEKLADEYPKIKVLYMSGYTANVIAHRGILDDGVNFISKPISRDVLAAKVRETLDNE
jgi:two-component system, cell cycle sensor histidine kinase and response regulator CckA